MLAKYIDAVVHSLIPPSTRSHALENKLKMKAVAAHRIPMTGLEIFHLAVLLLCSFEISQYDPRHGNIIASSEGATSVPNRTSSVRYEQHEPFYPTLSQSTVIQNLFQNSLHTIIDPPPLLFLIACILFPTAAVAAYVPRRKRSLYRYSILFWLLCTNVLGFLCTKNYTTSGRKILQSSPLLLAVSLCLSTFTDITFQFFGRSTRQPDGVELCNCSRYLHDFGKVSEMDKDQV